MEAKIGILGGIGPQATSIFYKKLINRLHKKGISNNTDYPQIVVNSIPGPELFLEDVDLSLYIKGLKELENIGVSFIAINCNTAYVHYNKFQNAVSVPIIDLPKEVLNYFKQKGISSFTVLGSSLTIKSDIYEVEGINHKRVSDEEIETFDKAIQEYICGRKDSRKKVLDIARKYSSEKNLLLVACTELSIILSESEFSSVDTMDILLDRILATL